MSSDCGLLWKCKINNKGTGNRIILQNGCILRGCTFNFYGSNNTVKIGENVSVVQSVFHMEDSNNTISINDNTKVCGKNEYACIEGTEITIGKDCLISGNIYFRTGDSHSVLDMLENRINPSKSIRICDHVWIGQSVIITKGVYIAEHSVVGIGSVVTRKFDECNIAIAGNPAKCIKQKINWDAKRIPIERRQTK